VIYWDTSALVKHFITEVGTSEALTFRRTQDVHATSMIAYPEVISALRRRHREGNLSDNQYRTARNLFFQDWPSYVRIPINGSLLERVVSVIERHPLRTLDALHLASLLQLQAEVDERCHLISADANLLRAAVAEGIETHQIPKSLA
jgi:predicted nucleic acid-binding protein